MSDVYMDGSKIVVLCYVDDCVYWYANEDLVKWFVDTLEKRFHAQTLVDQARYATSIVAKYLYTATVKVSTKFYKTTFAI